MIVNEQGESLILTFTTEEEKDAIRFAIKTMNRRFLDNIHFEDLLEFERTMDKFNENKSEKQGEST